MPGWKQAACCLGLMLAAAGSAPGQDLCPELAGNPQLLTPGTAVCALNPGGNATITMNDASLISWDQFNVAEGQTLNFNFLAAVANKTVVNFTTGSGSNAIDGTILSNGRVVLVTPGQRLDVAGVIQAESFLASSVPANDYGELLRRESTTFGGPSRLVRVEDGARIQADGGDVVLAGSAVSIAGTAMLLAPAGAVRIVAAGGFTLANSGEERITPTTPEPGANVVNNGLVRSATVEMKASTEITNGGLIQTNGGVGRVFLRVGPGGTVINSGTGMINGLLEVTGEFDEIGVVIDPDEGDAATTVRSAVSRFPALRRPGEEPGKETVVVDTGGVSASVDNSRGRNANPNRTVAANREALHRKSSFFGLRGSATRKKE